MPTKDHNATASPKQTYPRMDFHSPLDASISLKVEQKLKRYSAFFSSRVSLCQSPFSFSLNTCNEFEDRRWKIEPTEAFKLERIHNQYRSYINLGCGFLETNCRHGIFPAIEVTVCAVQSVTDNFSSSNFVVYLANLHPAAMAQAL